MEKELLERALAIDEKVFGANHSSTAVALNNLANAYGDLVCVCVCVCVLGCVVCVCAWICCVCVLGCVVCVCLDVLCGCLPVPVCVDCT